jgi:hypothetical protein
LKQKKIKLSNHDLHPEGILTNMAQSKLTLIPVELTLEIIKMLAPREIKQLSLVNKRLRAICMPYIFQSLTITFSKVGLERLLRISRSTICEHVSSFTYEAAPLLNTGASSFLNPGIKLILRRCSGLRAF